jgi:hypothetical protein
MNRTGLLLWATSVLVGGNSRCGLLALQVVREAGVNHVGVTLADMPVYFLDRIHRPTSRAIAVGIVFEVRLEDWFQQQIRRGLDDLSCDCGQSDGLIGVNAGMRRRH